MSAQVLGVVAAQIGIVDCCLTWLLVAKAIRADTGVQQSHESRSGRLMVPAGRGSNNMPGDAANFMAFNLKALQIQQISTAATVCFEQTQCTNQGGSKAQRHCGSQCCC